MRSLGQLTRYCWIQIVNWVKFSLFAYLWGYTLLQCCVYSLTRDIVRDFRIVIPVVLRVLTLRFTKSYTIYQPLFCLYLIHSAQKVQSVLDVASGFNCRQDPKFKLMVFTQASTKEKELSCVQFLYDIMLSLIFLNTITK